MNHNYLLNILLKQYATRHEVIYLAAVKVLLIVLKEIRPDNGFVKAETCRVIDYIVVACVTILSRNA
jgi:hypothetical protein